MRSATGSECGDGGISQPDGDGGPVVDDIVGGEADDAGDGLRVEENGRGGDPGPQGQGGVVNSPPENGEPAVLVQRRLLLCGDLGRKGEAGHPAGLHAPAEERLRRAPGGQLLGAPGVEYGLSALLDDAALVGEEGKEGAGLGDLLLGLVRPEASQRFVWNIGTKTGGPPAPPSSPRTGLSQRRLSVITEGW
ncbi:hypothetical protein [Streptomyces sp. NRRL F-5122]|uniref:hypothetical protein n=1 Tax=Streptomyces sp. NRRL F-5122 TaxID=1609098 RepID=UPI00131BC34F|nr:hypothetical protein [Streptomyces sp. NRRL F-5122]